jgi:leucyl/phenylalanyl-tRNA--protein transferase
VVDGEPDGPVAIGGDLEPGTLLAAYRAAMFPMPIGRRGRIGWWSPDPRAVLPLDRLRISRSLSRSLRRYDVTIDAAFESVIRSCADPKRPHGWITRDLIDAYTRLADLGWAHSVECWDDGELVGGLYGVSIGGFFAGESMFHRATDASKVALVRLVEVFAETDGALIDVQWQTPHLESLGVVEIPRVDYVGLLARAVEAPIPPDLR